MDVLATTDASEPGAGGRGWRTVVPGAAAWFAVALLARLPFVVRAEGLLDHDQSVVGLMALDIAAGRRLPLFFDGQRYMAAIEAYVAAAAVAILGHAPGTVAVAPWLFGGLFVAGQFAVWRLWRGRTAGHLAALLSVFGAPMLTLWSVVPRGGYVEFLAWALPTLAVHRIVTRPDAPASSPWRQAAWGFALALGYLINPLSLTVYATLAVDWTLLRHGAELRRMRRVDLDGLSPGLAAGLWLGLGLGALCLLAWFCHVDPRAREAGPYVALAGLAHGPRALGLGAAGVMAVLGSAAWWSTAPARLHGALTRRPWTLAGALLALSPFVLQAGLVRAGLRDDVPTLPVWIGAPWDAGANVRAGAKALGGLLGCDTNRAYESLLIGQGVDPPAPRRPGLTLGLLALSPAVMALVVLLVGRSTWSVREAWSRGLRLRGDDVSEPEVLCGLYLLVATTLFLVQGTSPNGSSMRYLVPLGVALPGLLASGILALPRRAAAIATILLLIPWGLAQVAMMGDIDRPHEARGLARELLRRDVRGIVAPPPVAIVVANLTHGQVGAVEYQPTWPRLANRDRDRLPTSGNSPIVCVVDRRFPWPLAGEVAWDPAQDFGRHLVRLARRADNVCTLEATVGPYEIWHVWLPLDAILAEEDDHADALR